MRVAHFILVVLCVALYVDAHGLLTSPKPRSGTNDNARTAVCGGGSKTAATVTWAPGGKATVTWNIHANHGGNVYGYLIGEGVAESQANFNKTKLFGPVAVAATGAKTNTFTVPNISCKACVFQWLWKSGEATPYYGCSDIAIQEGAPSAVKTPVASSANMFVASAIVFVSAVVAASL
eukprot:TRINITY_DN4207_c0_g1_i1.p1 TRINITY_DN4207_c0_g1~~TRINITY_DN4207_c0_g1_i1.p1  ORF type:complete len:178 (-),score=39.10 TRINITY_DN4207_c0_g1_i1:41-574(-)